MNLKIMTIFVNHSFIIQRVRELDFTCKKELPILSLDRTFSFLNYLDLIIFLTKRQTMPIPIMVIATGMTTGKTSLIPPIIPSKEVLVIRLDQFTVAGVEPPVATIVLSKSANNI